MWMMVWVAGPLFGITCTNNKIATRSAVEEVRHIVGACRHDTLVIIDCCCADRCGRSFMDDPGHGFIVDAWWAAFVVENLARSPERAGNASRNFFDAALQVITIDRKSV